jgi:hypothetical protein
MNDKAVGRARKRLKRRDSSCPGASVWDVGEGGDKDMLSESLAS